MNLNNTSNRVYGLDVLRAVAILIVLYGHGKILSGDAFSFIPDFPLIDGVELFFVLSGFLIGGILISTAEKEQKFDLKSLFIFWKRRWFRTLPTYYLILIVNIILTKSHYIEGDFEQYNYTFFLFCQNFSKGFYGFFWESWSLSVEEWFYILLPIIILGFSRFLSVKKTILFSISILLLFPLIYRFSISDLQVDQFWWDVEFRKVVLTRIDAINYGVLAAFIKFYYPLLWFKCRKWSFGFGLIVLYITILLPRAYDEIFFKTFYFNIIAIGAMLLLPLADSIKDYKNRYIGQFFTFFSKISYSLYLINLGIVISLIATNFKLQTITQHIVAYYSYWIIVVILSWIIYTYYENPIMKLRDKI